MKKCVFFISLILCMILLFGCSSTSPSQKPLPQDSKLGCDHNYSTQVVEATCTSNGYTLYKCPKCGDSYKDSIVYATGHHYIEREQNFKCSKCERYEDDGFSFELITSEMARYNDAYKGRVNTYEITSVSSKAIEDGKLTIPRKHLGYAVTGLRRGCLYNIRTSINTIVFGSNIKYIGSLLFCYDGQFSSPTQTLTLEKIVFDSDCKDLCISHTAFQFCKKVTDITFPSKCFISFNHDDMVGNHFLFEDTQYYKENVVCENGVYYLKDMALSSDKEKLSSNVIIKEGTRLIANQCFSENTNIKTVTIPSSVIYIGKKAFYKNLNLTSVIYRGSKNQFDSIILEENAFELCGTIAYSYNN